MTVSTLIQIALPDTPLMREVVRRIVRNALDRAMDRVGATDDDRAAWRSIGRITGDVLSVGPGSGADGGAAGEMVILLPNTPHVRTALHWLSEDAYDRGGSAASHEERVAWEAFYTQTKLALEPERLDDARPPDALEDR